MDFTRKRRELTAAIGTARIQSQVELIIMEEAEYFFQGRKPAEEVADIIANRVNIYLNENQ